MAAQGAGLPRDSAEQRRLSPQKWHNPASNRSAVVPDWGGRDLKMIVRAAERQLGLDWEVFDAA